jgi:Pentapeptide repeats (8 copies)
VRRSSANAAGWFAAATLDVAFLLHHRVCVDKMGCMRRSTLARAGRRNAPSVPAGLRQAAAWSRRRSGERAGSRLRGQGRVGVAVAAISAFAAVGTVVATGYATARSQRGIQGQLAVAQQQLAVAEQGQITERFGRATEQLGSPSLDVRLGGIYALERLTRDSSADQPTIVEVLSAFVRQHARERLPRQATSSPYLRPAVDVSAALTVLARRDRAHDGGAIVDLSRTNLARLELVQVNMRGADLNGADLSGAYVRSSDLTEADLHGADLTGAELAGTSLAGANLIGADLTGVDFIGHSHPDPVGAYMFGSTILVGADLGGADLDIPRS